MTTTALDFLFSLERLGMKFGLDTMSRLCEALDHPERAFPSLIIAGTNGKGSVTAMVHQGLLSAGLHAARYTSPHLERLEERYVIGSREVETEALERAVGTVRDAVERLLASGVFEAPPTFFECATAAAFVLFREARVDLAVLEVGLGGRLDATNVVAPLLAAITSIDFDHQAQLGDSIASIAFEKAGVIKPGIPVVCGELPAEAEPVVRAVCAGRGARYVDARNCADLDALLEGAPPALAGEHQRGNAAVAVCVLAQLEDLGFAIGRSAMRAAVTGVQWPGRLERIERRGTVFVLDAAHNPAGARALASYVGRMGRETTLVLGVMRDKDVDGMLEALAPAFPAVVCTRPDSPRALEADALAARARAVPGASWSVSVEASPAAALEAAARHSRTVVVAGSIFLTGPLRGILRAR